MKRTRFGKNTPSPEDEEADAGHNKEPAGNKGAARRPAIGLPALRNTQRATIQTPEEFDELVNEYVQHCMDSGEPITRNGLQLWLGFNSHQAFYYQCKRSPEFAQSVARACKIIEYTYEVRLNGSQPAGAIFALKNFGWTDEQANRRVGGPYTRRDGHARPLPPLGSPEEEDLYHDEGPAIDLSALDDDTLESLMKAISQETVARESYNGQRRTH